jgi:hypothetical protein
MLKGEPSHASSLELTTGGRMHSGWKRCRVRRVVFLSYSIAGRATVVNFWRRSSVSSVGGKLEMASFTLKGEDGPAHDLKANLLFDDAGEEPWPIRRSRAVSTMATYIRRC